MAPAPPSSAAPSSPPALPAPPSRSVSCVFRGASDSAIVRGTVAELMRMKSSGGGGGRSSKTEQVQCECCGLGEECTRAYVAGVKERFSGHFVCGLCSEAIKEEGARLEEKSKKSKEGSSSSGGGMQEAVELHMSVCKRFNCAVREKPLVAAASAMGQLLLRRSVASSGRGGVLPRSSSCMPDLQR